MLFLSLEFVRKVYSILTVQILGTALVSALYMSTASIKTWVQNK
jgi:FtsH-binding integral membrane protein